MFKLLWKKLYEKIKPFIVPFVAGVTFVLGIFGLCSIRRGLSSSNDSFGRISGTVNDIKDGNTKTAGIIDQLDAVNSGIKDTNGDAGAGIDSAIDGIDRAKEILSKAKHI